jgi:hypothetical protein
MGEREGRKRGGFSFRFFFAYVILGFQEKDCQAWRAAVERIASSEGKKMRRLQASSYASGAIFVCSTA